MAGWPNDSDVRERYNRSHPSYKIIRDAIQDGYHLIASCIGESGKPRPCWRLSFSRAGGILLQNLSEMSPLLVHKAAVEILKVLRKKNESELDPVSRVTGIPGWYWILGIKCSDTTGVGLVI